MYLDKLKQFKTRPCKRCKDEIIETALNLQCPLYHSEQDRRRVPITYSGIYLQDNFSSSTCQNYVEYLYHPDNFRTEKCADEVECRKYNICPYYHNEKERVEKKQRASMFQEEQKILSQLQALVNGKPKQLDEPNKEAGQSGSMDAKSITSNAPVIATQSQQDVSPPPLMPAFRQESTMYELISSRTVVSYFEGEQVSFREDRKHQFKCIQKLILKTHIPLWLQYICGFANCEGGTLYIGIDDDGITQGVQLTNRQIDKLQLEIDQGCKTKLTPPLLPQKYSVRFVPVRPKQKKSENFSPLFVVEIRVVRDRDEHHLYLYNRECYLRMNASNHRLSASEIIESLRVKHQKKYAKQVELQDAILKNNREYFESKKQEELKELKFSLEGSLASINKILSRQQVRPTG